MDRLPPGPKRVIALANAMGMVAVQAACTLDEALDLIVARAQGISCSPYDIALAVVDDSIRFGE